MNEILNDLRGLSVAKALFFLCAGCAGALSAQTQVTLFSFDGANGLDPGYGSLVQGTDGSFYGTTVYGGANCGINSGCGTVFKVTPGGTLTTLHRFHLTDGANPEGLVEATDGTFYGTTAVGGANGGGTIYKITSGGTLTTLHNFASTDGFNPVDALVQAADGDFYRTTYSGGMPSSNCLVGCGTIFKITPDGALTTLHSFDATDGAYPIAGLVEGTDGDFYGTTAYGGANCGANGGCGTVFKSTPGGALTTLHNFNQTHLRQFAAQRRRNFLIPHSADVFCAKC